MTKATTAETSATATSGGTRRRAVWATTAAVLGLALLAPEAAHAAPYDAAKVSAPAAVTVAPVAPSGVSAVPSASAETNGVMPTRFVLRNNTGIRMMVFAPLGGDMKSKTEFKVADLAPGAEFTIEGSNSAPGTSDVYLRLYSVKRGTNERDLFLGYTGAHNVWHGCPYVFFGAGDAEPSRYVDSKGLWEHETIAQWRVVGTGFQAWVHRDADTDNRKVMKMTINYIGY